MIEHCAHPFVAAARVVSDAPEASSGRPLRVAEATPDDAKVPSGVGAIRIDP